MKRYLIAIPLICAPLISMGSQDQIFISVVRSKGVNTCAVMIDLNTGENLGVIVADPIADDAPPDTVLLSCVDGVAPDWTFDPQLHILVSPSIPIEELTK